MRCTCGVERNGSISSVVFSLSAHRRKKCEQILQPCTQCSNWLICFSFLVHPKCLFVFVCFVLFFSKHESQSLKTRKNPISIVLLFGLLHMGGLSLALSCCVEDTPWPPCFLRRVGEPGPVADGGALVLPLLLQGREASISHPLQGVPCVLENSSYIRWMQTRVIRRSIFLPPSQIFY